MEKLSKLPNIGPVVENQLNVVGITSYAQLKELGSKNAWLKIQAIDSSACINRLLALEGAIQNVKKLDLPSDTKADLKLFYQLHKL